MRVYIHNDDTCVHVERAVFWVRVFEWSTLATRERETQQMANKRREKAKM